MSRKEEFIKDLKALLKKYNGEIEICTFDTGYYNSESYIDITLNSIKTEDDFIPSEYIELFWIDGDDYSER